MLGREGYPDRRAETLPFRSATWFVIGFLAREAKAWKQGGSKGFRG